MTKRLSTRHASLLALALLVSSLACVASVKAQRDRRDHLTPKEIELVRDAQELDARTGIFVKAAERRMQAIFGQMPVEVKQSKKEKEKEAQDADAWGDLPKASRADLLYDIANILDEAITNIDDTAQRDSKSPLIHRSVRKLSEAATRFLTQLIPLRASINDKSEREQLEQAIDNAQQIVDAAKKLPAEEKDAKDKPGKKG
ncbi:MAG: hypothetical protein QOE33_1811 [Acidobacteriota bacterium]|nr:hypothetical protein [Acidobacteriota bacterium]